MNLPTASFSRPLTFSGLGVAGVGFVLTRFTIGLTVYETPMQFYLTGLVPLVLGLSLTAFGVALVVGPFGPEFVRVTTSWCLAGFGTMVLLAVLTAAGSGLHGLDGLRVLLSETYVSNYLIGGSVGGTLTGVYAAQDARHRNELRWQANRLVTLNRILRHEVLNAITVITGHAEALDDDVQADGGHADPSHTVDVIQRKSDRIVDTIEDVEYLTETDRSAGHALSALDASECLETRVEAVRSRHPDAEIVLHDDHTEDASVVANARLEDLFDHLLENAVVHNPAETPRVEIDLDVGPRDVTVSIADDGPGLPDTQRSILEDGRIADHDDPSTGFGLNVVRLLAERFHGDLETTVTDDGTTVSVTLARATRTSHHELADAGSYGIASSRLATATVASLVAGGLMGVLMQSTTGAIPIVGALYGVTNPVVGWLTHEFHSVVFGLTYAALLTTLPARYVHRLRGCVGVGLAWGVGLWATAASVVMPFWLRLVGITATVPDFRLASLVGHLVWGVTLGVCYYLANEVYDARIAD